MLAKVIAVIPNAIPAIIGMAPSPRVPTTNPKIEATPKPITLVSLAIGPHTSVSSFSPICLLSLITSFFVFCI